MSARLRLLRRQHLAALGCVLLACGPAPTPRNVVLIVIDTLRWDHVGVYGASPRETSPELDAFAAGAVRFERAYATAPWTRPSIGSMITGLHPSAHGGTAVDRPLPEEALTLAEILRQRGFATRGVVSNWVISTKNGFAQGYDTYHEAAAALHPKPTSKRISRVAGEMLAELAAGPDPFLLFVHYFDPHYLYVHHPEIGWSGGEVGRVAEKPSIFHARKLAPSLTPEELANFRDLYAEEVRYTDAQVGRVLEALRALGLEDDTVVVITSDHGEEIFERGYLGHAHSLHEELLRVPLMVRAPGVAARVVEHPVSLVDLTPTLLQLAGVDFDDDDFQGRSLGPVLAGEAPAGDGILFGEVDYLPTKMIERSASKRAIVGPRFKLVRDRDSGALELYDLERDPDERSDLSEARPDLVARLLPILEERTRLAEERSLDAPSRLLSDDELEQLRALGYVPEEG